MTLIHRIVGKRKLVALDAFPKVADDYKQTSAAGGTVSIVSYLLILILLFSEISFYTDSVVNFYYTVDTDFDSKLKINVDITVAMTCDSIGADIIDTTNQNNAYTYGRLVEEPTFYEMASNQRRKWDTIRQLNNYLREEHHSLREFLWKKDTRNHEIFGRDLPPPDIEPMSPPDACRLHGTLTVNKVAGNFHVTVGKHIPLPIGHAHISLLVGRSDFNFSHRIEKFSFGEHLPSIINPLEGEEKVTSNGNVLYQYYIKVVSTDVSTSDLKVKTYQYTTTEKERSIDHEADSHGMPGIYFKYDMDAIAVKVVEEHKSFWQFLVRLCGIVGGVYATSGVLSTLVSSFVDIVTCKYLSGLRAKEGQFKVDINKIDAKPVHSSYQTVNSFSVPTEPLIPPSNCPQNGLHSTNT